MYSYKYPGVKTKMNCVKPLLRCPPFLTCLEMSLFSLVRMLGLSHDAPRAAATLPRLHPRSQARLKAYFDGLMVMDRKPYIPIRFPDRGSFLFLLKCNKPIDRSLMMMPGRNGKQAGFLP